MQTADQRMDHAGGRRGASGRCSGLGLFLMWPSCLWRGLGPLLRPFESLNCVSYPFMVLRCSGLSRVALAWGCWVGCSEPFSSKSVGLSHESRFRGAGEDAQKL